jgi:hypothetical protein
VKGLCRYDAYRVIAAQLEGGTYMVSLCDLAAVERVSVTWSGDGLGVDVQVDVCGDHGQLIGDHDDGFITARPLATAGGR